jgi:hypothetical protein
LSDTDTNELYEDFYLYNVTGNMTLTTDDFTERFNCGATMHFEDVGFVTETPYLHNEAELWKMSDHVNYIAGMPGRKIDGGRIKDILGVFFWKSMLKLDGDSQALYFLGNVDRDYIGYPQ